jgi:uncharacterized membrane protein (UPF0127 family)
MRLEINGIPIEFEVADTYFKRLKGLMGRKSLPPGNALLMYPCGSIHTFFIRFPIDVAYLDKSGVVLHTIRSMKPFRVGPVIKGAHYIVEVPCGTLDHEIVPEKRILWNGGSPDTT